ncbi:MAG: hypothetical protein GX096_00190 [Clostridiales bacterium]|nr:hypothetical protein [Clostridiales bacterium]
MMQLKLRQKTISYRTLSWLCVAVLLLSLTPLYAISFYNHACYDDYGYTIENHKVWQETGSLGEVLKGAADFTVGAHETWDANYTAAFINTMQPSLFGSDMYWISTVVLLTFFLASIWFFLRQVLVKTLHADRTTFWMAFSALAFVMIQFIPDVSEAFFWFNGGVAYTLSWSFVLLRIGTWIGFENCKKKHTKVLVYLLMLLLTVAVGGIKYTPLLLALLGDACLLLYAFAKKRPARWLELALSLLLVGLFIFTATSPANVVRSATLSEGLSAPMAILQSFFFGIALMGNWFSLPLVVVWAMVAWQIAEALHGSPKRFNHPIWITILCLCLFCAQLTPTLYTGNYIGDGRAQNTYFYTFVLMGCALSVYWAGWILRRTEGKTVFPAIGTAKKDGLRIGAFVVAMVLLIVGCVAYHPEGTEGYGPQNMASGSALMSLLTGEAQRYDEQMDEREAILSDPDQTEVEISPLEEIPAVFMGDDLNSNVVDYVLHLYGEYFDKESVRIAEEE